jgi:hypothetical protein
VLVALDDAPTVDLLETEGPGAWQVTAWQVAATIVGPFPDAKIRGTRDLADARQIWLEGIGSWAVEVEDAMRKAAER